MSRSKVLSSVAAISGTSFLLLVALACGRKPGAEVPQQEVRSSRVVQEKSSSSGEATLVPLREDDGLGGRLFDRFFDKRRFSPDDKRTKGLADGRGGPFDDGTLALGGGARLLNDDGHDYRLKNFFGWDLRGAQGIYGPNFHDKSFVVPVNLLDPALPLSSITELLTRGSDEVPAYAGVLDQRELEEVVHFVQGVREGRLPHPDQIWSLSEGTVGNYRLSGGADVNRGKQLYGERCGNCHGADGTQLIFDDGEFSLGSHARQKAYEDWFKILNGQPGTSMRRFVDGDGKEMGQQILDILAALCDRSSFPLGEAAGPDVEDGDVRCGEYLR